MVMLKLVLLSRIFYHVRPCFYTVLSGSFWDELFSNNFSLAIDKDNHYIYYYPMIITSFISDRPGLSDNN